MSGSEPIVFEARRYKIILHRDKPSRSSSSIATESVAQTTATTDSAINGQDKKHSGYEVRDEQAVLSKQESLILSNEIKNEILPIFRNYQRLWQWYCQWIPFFQTLLSKTRYFISPLYMKYAILLNFICKMVAMIAFFLMIYFDSAATSTTPTVLVWVGFLSLYLNCCLYLQSSISGIIVKICEAIINTPQLDRIDYPMKALNLFVATGILILISVFLLHLKSVYSQSYSYTIVPFPFFIGLIIMNFLLLNHYRYYSLSDPCPVPLTLTLFYVLVSISLVPTGFFLLGQRSEQHGEANPTIAMAITPFYFAEYFVGIVLIRWLNQILTIRQYTSIEERSSADYRIKMLYLGLRWCCVGIFLAIAIYSNVEMIRGEYSLWQGMGMGVLWVLVAEIMIVIQWLLWNKFDKLYLC